MPALLYRVTHATPPHSSHREPRPQSLLYLHTQHSACMSPLPCQRPPVGADRGIVKLEPAFCIIGNCANCPAHCLQMGARSPGRNSCHDPLAQSRRCRLSTYLRLILAHIHARAVDLNAPSQRHVACSLWRWLSCGLRSVSPTERAHHRSHLPAPAAAAHCVRWLCLTLVSLLGSLCNALQISPAVARSNKGPAYREMRLHQISNSSSAPAIRTTADGATCGISAGLSGVLLAKLINSSMPSMSIPSG